jgi:hypothetical protein
MLFHKLCNHDHFLQFYSFYKVKTARTDVELYKALRQVSKLSQMVSHPSVLPVHRYKTLSLKKI